MKCIIGRKLEMTQKFRDDGTVVPVTLVKAVPCTVVQVKSMEKDGYLAIQIGCEPGRSLNKPETGHLKDLPALKVLREFRVDSTDLKRGDTIEASILIPGEKVDVIGQSKGRGFQGVVKRHGFSGSPASHGHKDQLRMPGSIGSRRQGPVAKGKRMAGHMGDDRVTVKNLEIFSVDSNENVVAIKGAIPGAHGALVLIQTRESKSVWQK